MAKKTIKEKTPKLNKSKPHDWRLCSYGEHWVTTHPMHIPPIKKNPAGALTTRQGHCARNPSGKDQMYPDEIKAISERQFKELGEKPCPIQWDFENGSEYDDLIAGWTQYWNDVLQPEILLEPNLVKALIASESGFRPEVLAKKSNKKSARGLMQITNVARKALGNEKGEIKDHYLTLSIEELNDPSNNICAGIRWLFQKQKLASGHLGHNADWIETIKDYKGLKIRSAEKSSKFINIFNKYLEDLNKCQKE